MQPTKFSMDMHQNKMYLNVHNRAIFVSFKKRVGKQNICTWKQQREETSDTQNSRICKGILNKDRQRCYVLNKSILYENCAWVTEVRMGPIFGVSNCDWEGAWGSFWGSVLDLDPSANYIGFRYAKIQQRRHLIFLLSTIFKQCYNI